MQPNKEDIISDPVFTNSKGAQFNLWEYQRTMLLLWVLTFFVCLCAGFGLGLLFTLHTDYIENIKPKHTHPPRVAYTVLDADRVIMQSGDTVNYQWQQRQLRK